MAAGFYFAWTDETETTFGVEHQRKDENVFSIGVTHTEGQFCELSIEIRNPNVGLLSPGRFVWVWLSYDDGAGTVTPLFRGRLIAIPDDITEEVVALAFVARPEDYAEQLEALAATLRTPGPFWDPVFIAGDAREDPQSVLEARTALWHTDRVTSVLTISDIITGEDGTLTLLEADQFEGSVKISYGSPPVRRVQCTAEVSWTQRAAGTVDVTAALIQAFRAGGDTAGAAFVSSYTWEGLQADWPKDGQAIGSGWTIGTTTFDRVDDKFQVPQRWVLSTNNSILAYTLGVFKVAMVLKYDAARERREVLSFALDLDVQSIVTEPGDEETLLVSLASSDLDQPIDLGGAMPIVDVRRPAYFRTDRGRVSAEYAIAVARARALARARAVNVTADTYFENGFGLSLRQNAVIVNPQIPGGTAAGKIVGYTISADGRTGVFKTSITVGCCCGQGNTVSGVAGVESYVEAGVLEDGIQIMTGAVIMPIAGSVTYDDFSGTVIDDDGVDLFNMNAANSLDHITVFGTINEQQLVLADPWADAAAVGVALNEAYTEVELAAKPLKTTEGFLTNYPITVSALMAPKTIDLEAA